MFRSRDRGRDSSDRGAALVEFAIIVPVLVMLLFGIIEFSVAYNRNQALHASAREGARYGSLPTSNVADIKTFVQTAFAGTTFDATPTIIVGMADGGISADTDLPCNDTTVGYTGKVYVEVTVNESIEIPIVGNRTVTLTGKGVFQCEPTG